MNLLPVTLIKFSILTSCFLCYFHSLDGNFTFDDQVGLKTFNGIGSFIKNVVFQVAIVKNRDVTNGRTSYSQIFNNDFWGNNLTDPTSHKSYRPLTILYFHWEHQLFGLNAFYMKCTNLLLHCLVCLLLSHVLPILLPTVDKSWLFKATILFAVHPIHCEV